MKKDIFDRIMDLAFLKPLQPFYKKNKEILLYLFFGGLTFCVSVISYAYFDLTLGFNELIANLFSWILAVLFAYITNKIWVFKVQFSNVRSLIKEVFNFFGGRIVTLILEEIILFVFISKLDMNSIAIKVFAQIIVIVSNYFISKFFVFKNATDI